MWFEAGVLLMIVCMVMMFRMMGHGRRHTPWMGEWSRGNRSDAEGILAERLARGEIDTEEYERLRAALRQPDSQRT